MSWTPARSPQPLGLQEAHVWRIALTTTPYGLDRDRLTLSAEELARASRYSNEDARRRFVVCRAALRRLLGDYLAVAPRTIPLATGRHGKTSLATDFPQRLEFNLSHSADLALIALAHLPVGVDIEFCRADRDLESLAETAFSDRELAAWKNLPSGDRAAGFYETWVRKEAFVKATGRGLGFGFKKFDVSIGRELPSRVECIGGLQKPAEGWSLLSLDPGTGYCGALAVAEPGIEVRCFEAARPE